MSPSCANSTSSRPRLNSCSTPPFCLVLFSFLLWFHNLQKKKHVHPRLDVLGQPADTIAVSLAHDDGAHKHLDRADTLQRDLALAGGLVQAELVAEDVLGDGAGVVNLVAEDDKGDLGQLLHGQERVELGLGLGESLVVLGVDEEDDAVDLGEVISPDTTG